MALKIKLSRNQSGSKRRPFYSVVVADSRMPRDGRFIEKIGTFDPRLPKDSERRVVIDSAKAADWIKKGAKPTDRVARFLSAITLEGEKTPIYSWSASADEGGKQPSSRDPSQKELLEGDAEIKDLISAELKKSWDDVTASELDAFAAPSDTFTARVYLGMSDADQLAELEKSAEQFMRYLGYSLDDSVEDGNASN